MGEKIEEYYTLLVDYCLVGSVKCCYCLNWTLISFGRLLSLLLSFGFPSDWSCVVSVVFSSSSDGELSLLKLLPEAPDIIDLLGLTPINDWLIGDPICWKDESWYLVADTNYTNYFIISWSSYWCSFISLLRRACLRCYSLVCSLIGSYTSFFSTASILASHTIFYLCSLTNFLVCFLSASFVVDCLFRGFYVS